MPLWGLAYFLGVLLGDGLAIRWEVARTILWGFMLVLLVALYFRRWHGWALLLLALAIGATAQARRPPPFDPEALAEQLSERTQGQLPGPRGRTGAPEQSWLGDGIVLEAPVPVADGLSLKLQLRELGAAGALPTLWQVEPAPAVQLLVRGVLREPLWPGDRVRLRGGLHPAVGRRNPGALDPQRLAVGRDIAAFASIDPDSIFAWAPSRPGEPADPRATERSVPMFALRWIARLRARLHDAVARNTTGPGDAASGSERTALLLAVTLGDRGALQQIDRSRQQRGEPPIEAQFRAAGIAHVLSVSGLHLVVATWLFFVALAWVMRRIGWLAQRFEVRSLAALLALPAALLYTLLTGASLATVRAVGAAGVGLLALGLHRRARPAEALTAAALFIVLPWHSGNAALLCFEPSLQLSAAAAWALAFLRPLGGEPSAWRSGAGALAPRWARALLRLRRLLWHLVEGSLAATLATLPLAALYFGSVPGAVLLGNLLAVPLVEIGVLPAGLLGAVLALALPRPGGLLLSLAGLAAAGAIRIAACLARLGWEIAVAAPGPGVIALWIVGLLVLHRHRRLGWALLAVAVALFLWSGRSARGDLRVTVLDVGQGDGVVVELPAGGVIVIDGGLRAGSADAGSAVLAPFLRRRGHRRIDVMVASHPHPDHIGGLVALLEQFQVGELWAAPGWESARPDEARSAPLWTQLLSTARRRGVSLRPPRDVRLQGVEVIVRGPCLSGSQDPDRVDGDAAAPWPPGSCRIGARPGFGHNDNSIVLELRFAGRSILLPGDIEREGERALVARAGQRGGAATQEVVDVLKAPHHCSRTSSGEELLALLRPRAVICSVGRKNRFGFPHPEVVSRYAAAGATLLRTDRDGAVQIKILPTGALHLERTAR